ncbi:unnamed protein product, partial [Prorocentrum cordatum]
MLLLHLCSTALFCALAVSHPMVCGVAAFIVSFSYWGVNFIAVELENPYGSDDNDLPLREMQEDMNKSLLCLLQPKAQKPPAYNYLHERDGLVGDGGTIRQVFIMDDYLTEIKASLAAGSAPVDVADVVPTFSACTVDAARRSQPAAHSQRTTELEVDNCLQGTYHAGSVMTGNRYDSNYRDSQLEHYSSALHKAHDACVLGKKS